MSARPPSTPLTTQAAALLTERQAELSALLQAAAGAAVGSVEREHDVVDFKDVAAEETQAAVADVATAHATQELTLITEALRRIDSGTYGECVDCGESIDERRLLAMPATACCTSCQTARERVAAHR